MRGIDRWTTDFLLLKKILFQKYWLTFQPEGVNGREKCRKTDNMLRSAIFSQKNHILMRVMFQPGGHKRKGKSVAN